MKKILFEICPFIIFLFIGVALIFYFNCPSKQISGVVSEVEYNTETSSSLFSSSNIKQTIVRFEDGRTKVFNNIKGIIHEGKFNTIYYNKDGGIVYVCVNCVKIK